MFHTLGGEGKAALILKKRMERQSKKSPGLTIEIANDFPESLIIEILSWLPVKTLLQFKRVCKSWYAIIKSAYFISKHLQNYYNHSDDFRNFYIAQFKIGSRFGELGNYEMFVDCDIQRVLTWDHFETPICNTYIVGPCNGIFYLCCWFNSDRRFLWNPALNELKWLPPLVMNPNHPSHVVFSNESYGFGYDPFKDYKVIVIMSFKDTKKKGYFCDKVVTDYPLSVFIYSLRNNSWIYWGDLSRYYSLKKNYYYIFVNRNLYWLGSSQDYDACNFVISFDLSTETYREMPLPDYERLEDEGLALAVIHDSVAFLVVQHDKCFTMWKLNEGCWNKKCSATFDFDVFRPFGHWNNKVLLSIWEGNALYDPETQEWQQIPHPESERQCWAVSAYKESLVSVN